MNRSRIKANGTRNLPVFIGSRSYTDIFASIMSVSYKIVGCPDDDIRVPPTTKMLESVVCMELI